MISPVLKLFEKDQTDSNFYLLLLLGSHIGLLIPPTRLLATLVLIGLLPGYLLSERLDLWKDPFFGAVGSATLSFFLSPLIILPACLIINFFWVSFDGSHIPIAIRSLDIKAMGSFSLIIHLLNTLSIIFQKIVRYWVVFFGPLFIYQLLFPSQKPDSGN